LDTSSEREASEEESAANHRRGEGIDSKLSRSRPHDQKSVYDRMSSVRM
jgi:hypothetical protein